MVGWGLGTERGLVPVLKEGSTVGEAEPVLLAPLGEGLAVENFLRAGRLEGRLELVIGRLELVVGRLELVIGRLELVIGRLELVIGPLVRRGTGATGATGALEGARVAAVTDGMRLRTAAFSDKQSLVLLMVLAP